MGTTTAIYNKYVYNSRGQLAEIREGLTPNNTSWQRGAIINFYSPCWGMCGGSNSTTPMPNNNGNLKIQQVFIPQTDASDYEQHYDVSTQFFEYDALNRLQFTNEASWRQWYSYDQYGNRTINTDPNLTYGPVNNLGFEVQTSKNRLYAPGDLALPETSRRMQYDDAGNLKADTYTGQGTRTYDAENRMTGSAGVSPASYVYDADGHRVKRIVGSTETWQVYGIGGELLAEYSATGALQKEYGYRNGQLLITATAGAGTGWGPPPAFDDNPLNPHYSGETTVRAAHITQLHGAIDALRGHLNYAAYSWQYSATTNDLISANPIIEMRTALDQALGAPSGGYAAGLAYGQPILAIHIQELRNRVLNAWNGSSGAADVRWLVSDQLGTPRMVFDQSGSLAGVSRHDYLPFGEELFAGTGGRTTAQGYSVSDGLRQHFTRKERDNETGLDYFEARYYSSTQGRFTSPDEFAGGPEQLFYFEQTASSNPTFYAELEEPQTLNKYHYALNNPLRYVDPDGHQAMADALRTSAAVGAAAEAVPGGQAVGTTILVVTGVAAVGYVVYNNWDSIKHGLGRAVQKIGENDPATCFECPPIYYNKPNERNDANPNQQGQGQSKTASPNPNDPNKKPIFGEKGTQTTSTTVGNGKGWRVDVENPNPGQRPGQIHYQAGDKKYLYNPNSNSFVGASKTENRRLLSDPQVQRAIKKGLKVLGEN